MSSNVHKKPTPSPQGNKFTSCILYPFRSKEEATKSSQRTTSSNNEEWRIATYQICSIEAAPDTIKVSRASLPLSKFNSLPKSIAPLSLGIKQDPLELSIDGENASSTDSSKDELLQVLSSGMERRTMTREDERKKKARVDWERAEHLRMLREQFSFVVSRSRSNGGEHETLFGPHLFEKNKENIPHQSPPNSPNTSEKSKSPSARNNVISIHVSTSTSTTTPLDVSPRPTIVEKTTSPEITALSTVAQPSFYLLGRCNADDQEIEEALVAATTPTDNTNDDSIDVGFRRTTRDSHSVQSTLEREGSWRLSLGAVNSEGDDQLEDTWNNKLNLVT